MRRKWIVLAVAGLAVAAPASWYFGSPYWTLHEMRSAAVAGDQKALDRHIDYPALRRSTKGRKKELHALLAPKARSTPEAAARFDKHVSRDLSDESVNEEVSPTAMLDLFRPGVRGGEASGIAEKTRRDDAIVRLGLNRFQLRDRNIPKGESGFTFRRHRLSWKLEEIEWQSGPAARSY